MRLQKYNMEVKTSSLKITKIQESKIGQVDFDNLPFGKVFTDHMMYCDFKDGEWQQPQIVPYGPMQFEPFSKEENCF